MSDFRKMLDQRLLNNTGGGYQSIVLAQRKGEPVREIKQRHTSLQGAIACAMNTAQINRAKAVFINSLAKDGKTWKSVDADGYVYSDERPFDHITGSWIDKAKLIDSCNAGLSARTVLSSDEIAAKIGMTRPA